MVEDEDSKYKNVPNTIPLLVINKSKGVEEDEYMKDLCNICNNTVISFHLHKHTLPAQNTEIDFYIVDWLILNQLKVKQAQYLCFV